MVKINSNSVTLNIDPVAVTISNYLVQTLYKERGILQSQRINQNENDQTQLLSNGLLNIHIIWHCLLSSSLCTVTIPPQIYMFSGLIKGNTNL